MLQTRRAALRCTRNLRTRPQQKRFESSHNSEPSHSSHAHDAHHPSGPVNEHFGVRPPLLSSPLPKNPPHIYTQLQPTDPPQRNFNLTLPANPLGLAV